MSDEYEDKKEPDEDPTKFGTRCKVCGEYLARYGEIFLCYRCDPRVKQEEKTTD